MTAYNDRQTLKRISLDAIDYDDRRYKISRNRIDDGLLSSVREFGVLDPPVVVEGDGLSKVVFGFNRLRALREAGAEAAVVLAVPAVDPEWYAGRVLLKCHRNEVGPLGRLRAHAIMKGMAMEAGRLDRIAKQGLRLPDDFTRDSALAELEGELPALLGDYLDCRDIQFRVIRDLARLPRVAHGALAGWISYTSLRVNIFRFIVDMLTDMMVRDGSVDFVREIQPDGSIDRKQWEDHLYRLIREARYPDYSASRNRADDIVRYFASRGIDVDYPPYFEGDRVKVTVSLGRRDDPASIRKRIDEADLSKLKELLELL